MKAKKTAKKALTRAKKVLKFIKFVRKPAIKRIAWFRLRIQTLTKKMCKKSKTCKKILRRKIRAAKAGIKKSVKVVRRTKKIVRRAKKIVKKVIVAVKKISKKVGSVKAAKRSHLNKVRVSMLRKAGSVKKTTRKTIKRVMKGLVELTHETVNLEIRLERAQKSKKHSAARKIKASLRWLHRSRTLAKKMISIAKAHQKVANKTRKIVLKMKRASPKAKKLLIVKLLNARRMIKSVKKAAARSKKVVKKHIKTINKVKKAEKKMLRAKKMAKLAKKLSPRARKIKIRIFKLRVKMFNRAQGGAARVIRKTFKQAKKIVKKTKRAAKVMKIKVKTSSMACNCEPKKSKKSKKV